MKHVFRDSFIWLIHVLGISAVYRLCIRRRGVLVRVVTFHDAPDRAWFEGVVTVLSESYNILTPDQFHERQFNRNKINILLTFDDGYRSWIDVVAPVLKKYSVKGLFFVSSGLLNAADTKGKVEKYMKEQLQLTPVHALTWDGAEQLVAEGHTIGGHTVFHHDLTQLDAKSVTREIEQDKSNLESHLRAEIIDFAYPFGTKLHYNKQIQEQVMNTAYTHIYNAETGFVNMDTLDIRRTLIERQQPIRSVRSWIEGGYDVFSVLKSAVL